METKTIVRKEKTEIVANLTAAALLLAVGLLLVLFRVEFNNKAVIACSFVPAGMALAAWYKLHVIRKYPKQMKPLIISLSDERLVAARNQADAITHAIIQWLLRLSFFCYTLIMPEDVFESVGWWILFALFFISVFAPIIALRFTSGQEAQLED